jgi:hypothetical protein
MRGPHVLSIARGGRRERLPTRHFVAARPRGNSHLPGSSDRTRDEERAIRVGTHVAFRVVAQHGGPDVAEVAVDATGPPRLARPSGVSMSAS